MAKRLLDGLFTAVAIIFAIPTILVLVSWNAIPGDGLYSLKSGLEDVVLMVFSATPLVQKASVQFTDRRFDEATKLLAQKGSTVGYDLLLAEAQQTQNYIVQKKDGEVGVQFTDNIEKYQQEIVEKKIEVQAKIQAESTSPSIITTTTTTTTTLVTPAPVKVVVPTNEPTSIKVPVTSTSVETGQVVVVNKPEVVVIKQESNQELLQKLESTENKLEEIKQEIKRDVPKKSSNKRREEDEKLQKEDTEKEEKEKVKKDHKDD
ncbi:hypothetical protein ISR94_02525 [Candidatus Microgenomates bacterium]|nr:hypothetical protein [Candidatus Microgenomates bacterium]